MLETKCIWDVGGTLWFCPEGMLGSYFNKTGSPRVCQTGFGEGRGGEKCFSSKPAVPLTVPFQPRARVWSHSVTFNPLAKGRGCPGFQELRVFCKTTGVCVKVSARSALGTVGKASKPVWGQGS